MTEQCRELVDVLFLSFDDEKNLDYLETNRGRIDLTPSVRFAAGEMYRLELFDNGTIAVWQLVVNGEKGAVQ